MGVPWVSRVQKSWEFGYGYFRYGAVVKPGGREGGSEGVEKWQIGSLGNKSDAEATGGAPKLRVDSWL